VLQSSHDLFDANPEAAWMMKGVSDHTQKISAQGIRVCTRLSELFAAVQTLRTANITQCG
jgi:hypothetical protein